MKRQDTDPERQEKGREDAGEPAAAPGPKTQQKAQEQERDLERRMNYDLIEPVGWRVVIRKDENKRTTRSGLVLPDSKEIPVITGRIIAVSKEVEGDDDTPIRVYDKVLFDPREAIPVELEHDNKLFVVSVDKVVAVFRRKKTAEEEAAEAEAEAAAEAEAELEEEEDDEEDEA